MRLFELHRIEDVTGVSGTGTVAEGVQFTDGTVAIRWLTQPASAVFWDSIEDAMKVHGHHGMTKLWWITEEEV